MTKSVKNKHSINQSFPLESAGRRMIAKVPRVDSRASVADIRKMLIEKIRELETINYIYVVDGSKKLKGVVSVKDVFLWPESTAVSEIMTKDLISVRPHTDQEKAAILAVRHSLKAVPVVDKENHLLGVISSDVISNILYSENLEDVLSFAGVGKLKDPSVSIINAPALIHFQKRLPWLVLGLAGATVSVFVVSFFENILKEQLALAAFIPAVVYMADAVGTQVQTLFIRSIAISTKIDLKKYIWREVKVNFLLAFLLGITISLIPLFRGQSGLLGAILGVSIFVAMFTAMIVAMFISWVLDRMKCDPAIASGPLTTIIQDILSLLIYFSVAQVMLNLFSG